MVSLRKYSCLVFVLVVLIVLFLNYKYKVYCINNDAILLEKPIVKILTFNLNASANELSDENAIGLIRILKEEKPDIICFQESCYATNKKYRYVLDDDYYYSDTIGQDLYKRHILYSHYPFSNFRKISNESEIYSADIIIGGHVVALYSCHLESNGYSTARRSIISQDGNWIEGLPLYFRNTLSGINKRCEEAKLLARCINSEIKQNKSILVVGDLNDFSGSECLNIIMGNILEDAWESIGNGFGFTYLGWNLKLRIDHILYSKKDFQPASCRVINTNISDHEPLVVELYIK